MGYFSVTTKPNQLLLFYLSLASLINPGLADPPYRLCSNTTYNSTNSQFQYNLGTLFSYLSSNATSTKLFNTSTGTGLDRVYGQYMCLNYISNSSCSSCVGTASKDITQLCPDNKEAVVWEEECQLRYSNRNFFGQLDVSGNIPLDNKENISNPEMFTSLVNQTVTNLTKQAAFYPAANKYATGQAAYLGNSETLYALVECTTDLSPEDCQICLQVALENITSWYYFSRGARLLSRSCYLRYELYAFYDGATAESESPAQEQSGKSRTWVILLVAVITAAFVAAIILAVYCLTRRKVRDMINDQYGQFHNTGGLNYTEFPCRNFQERDGLGTLESPLMDLASILRATNNFSEFNLIGKGGFGHVYKGLLTDGKEVAVKRLSIDSEQGNEEFTNEVLLIMKLQHKNLVRLLGFCVDGGEKLLVYEFMPNNSLDIILFDPRKREQLEWTMRVNIIHGIARGMLYLHQDSRQRIIHRDLKASNILLDNDMNPKISDFGMARIYAGSEGGVNTARVVGTCGYMAPEYAMDGLYSIKSDVFSFGVLLLEIITGSRNTGFNRSMHIPNLVAFAWQLWNEGNALELADPLLMDSCCSDEFLRYMHIGFLCVQQDASDRPTMSSVVSMLKNETAELPQPERPGFTVGRFTDHYELQSKEWSLNGLSVSSILPR